MRTVSTPSGVRSHLNAHIFVLPHGQHHKDHPDEDIHHGAKDEKIERGDLRAAEDLHKDQVEEDGSRRQAVIGCELLPADPLHNVFADQKEPKEDDNPGRDVHRHRKPFNICRKHICQRRELDRRRQNHQIEHQLSEQKLPPVSNQIFA